MLPRKLVLKAGAVLDFDNSGDTDPLLDGNQIVVKVSVDDTTFGFVGSAEDTEAFVFTILEDLISPWLADLGPNALFVQSLPPVLLDFNVDAIDLQLDVLNSGLGDWTGASLQVARQNGADPVDAIGSSAVARLRPG